VTEEKCKGERVGERRDGESERECARERWMETRRHTRKHAHTQTHAHAHTIVSLCCDMSPKCGGVAVSSVRQNACKAKDERVNTPREAFCTQPNVW
jgi:hypothetical protein